MSDDDSTEDLTPLGGPVGPQCKHKWVLNRCVRCGTKRGSSASHYDELRMENARLLTRAIDAEALYRGCFDASDALRREIGRLKGVIAGQLEDMRTLSATVNRLNTENLSLRGKI